MECTPGKELMKAKDFLEAETECRKDSGCTGFYEFCERSNKFFACHQGFPNKTSQCQSVLYLKGTSISYSTDIKLYASNSSQVITMKNSSLSTL